MSQPMPIFDETVEKAALEFFGDADAPAIARCRGITYEDAVRQLQVATENKRREAARGGPITVDGRNGVLMWFVASAQQGQLRSPTRTSWWRRLLGR